MSCCESGNKRFSFDNTIGIHICEGESIQLFADACPGSSFLWEPEDYLSNPTSNSPIAVPPETTCYTVTIKNVDRRLECRTRYVVNVHPFAQLKKQEVCATLCMGQKLPMGASLEKACFADCDVEYRWNPVLGLDNPCSLNPNAIWAAFPSPNGFATTNRKIIYYDSFNRKEQFLNGNIPDIVDPEYAGSKWFTSTGTIHQNEANIQSRSIIQLPFSPKSNKIYTLCANANVVDTSNDSFIFLGFVNNNIIYAIQQLSMGSSPPLKTRILGTVTNHSFSEEYESNGKMQIVLNTTEQTMGFYTISMYYGNKNGQLRPLIENESVPKTSITNVFATTNFVGTVENFLLTCADATDMQIQRYTLESITKHGCVDSQKYCLYIQQDFPPVPCISAFRIVEENCYNDILVDSNFDNDIFTDTFEKVLGTDPNVKDFVSIDLNLEEIIYPKQKPLGRHFIPFISASTNKRQPIYICQGETVALCGSLSVDCRQTSVCVVDSSDVNQLDISDSEKVQLKTMLRGLVYTWSIVGGESLGKCVDPHAQCIRVNPCHNTLYRLQIDDACTGCRADMDAYIQVNVQKVPALQLCFDSQCVDAYYLCRPPPNSNPLLFEICVCSDIYIPKDSRYRWFGKWEDLDTSASVPANFFLTNALSGRIDNRTKKFYQHINVAAIYADFDQKVNSGTYNYIYCLEVCLPRDPHVPESGLCPIRYCFEVIVSSELAPSSNIFYVPSYGEFDQITCAIGEGKVAPVLIGNNSTIIVCDKVSTQLCTDNPLGTPHLRFSWEPKCYFDNPSSPSPLFSVLGFHEKEPPLVSGDKITVTVKSTKTHCSVQNSVTLDIRPSPCVEISDGKTILYACAGSASNDVLYIKPCLTPVVTAALVTNYCVRIREKRCAHTALTLEDLDLTTESYCGGTILKICAKAIQNECKVGTHYVRITPQSIENDSEDNNNNNGCVGPYVDFQVIVLPHSDLGSVQLCFSGNKAFQELKIDYEHLFPSRSFDLYKDFTWNWSGVCPLDSLSIITEEIPIVNPHEPCPIITLQTLSPLTPMEKCKKYCLWLTAIHTKSQCVFSMDVIITIANTAAKLSPSVTYVCCKKGKATITNENGQPNIPTSWKVRSLHSNKKKPHCKTVIGPHPGNHSISVSCKSEKDVGFIVTGRVEDLLSPCGCVYSEDSSIVYFVEKEPNVCADTMCIKSFWCALIVSDADKDNRDVGTYVLKVPLPNVRKDLQFSINLNGATFSYDVETETLFVFAKVRETETLPSRFTILWSAYTVCCKTKRISGSIVVSAPNNPESFCRCDRYLVCPQPSLE